MDFFRSPGLCLPMWKRGSFKTHYRKKKITLLQARVLKKQFIARDELTFQRPKMSPIQENISTTLLEVQHLEWTGCYHARGQNLPATCTSNSSVYEYNFDYVVCFDFITNRHTLKMKMWHQLKVWDFTTTVSMFCLLIYAIKRKYYQGLARF